MKSPFSVTFTKENTIFLGLIKKVQNPTETAAVQQQVKLGGESNFVRREDMPECIKKVLHDYANLFPQDLPPGLPPVRKGHEFKIDLEDDTLPVHRPLYKLSPLELEEA